MLINIDYHPAALSRFNHPPKLLFVCKAVGLTNAIPRMMHSHLDRLEIMFIYKGKGNYIINGEFYSVKEGDILIFNSGSIHDEQPLPSEDLVIYSCGITDLSFSTLPLNHIIDSEQLPVVHCGHYSELLKNMFEFMFCSVDFKSSIKNELIQQTLLTFLLIIQEIFTQRVNQLGSKKITLGQRIKDKLDLSYAENITINALSESLNVNRYYLCHVFKNFMGLSPKQYIIRRRLGEAQSLLLNTDDSVEKIASQVGYPNVNNFHAIFEKVIGMTPIKYKKAWLKRYNTS